MHKQGQSAVQHRGKSAVGAESHGILVTVKTISPLMQAGE